MGFNRFGLLIGLRLLVILCALGAIGLLFVTGGYPTAMALLGLICVALTVELFGFVSKTNREVSRFLDAARYADFGQRFNYEHQGAGFAELGETFSFIMNRFSDSRSQHEEERRHLRALLEHVPVPLISVHGDHKVTLWNNAARRLFGTTKVVRLDDIASFGVTLPSQLLALVPGQRVLMHFRIEDQDQALSVAASVISIGSKSERLLSLQNIQSELDTMQSQAWQDLVRVLTHEIMNSITPVASLAKTAVDLVDDVRRQVTGDQGLVDELDDVKNAVNTVARRSDGLTTFVASYRKLAQLPQPTKQNFLISDLFLDVVRIAQADPSSTTTEIIWDVQPSQLDLHADQQLVEQLMINLLRNAQQALHGQDQPCIELRARLNARGGVAIEVLDNGPGISPELAVRIFVPFFTTRKEGSGVGLALSRQIMLAHGGSLSYSPRHTGGARFSLAF